ncbi:hypothetical protein [Nostoc sp.]|uniref:hypothetical protein n=1 Tax=Nostoc sp. TaxID=1180 RepID=UPI002FF7E6D7
MSVYNTSDRTAKISDLDYNSGLGTIVSNPGETLKLLALASEAIKKLKPMRHFLSISMVQRMLRSLIVRG